MYYLVRENEVILKSDIKPTKESVGREVEFISEDLPTLLGTDTIVKSNKDIIVAMAKYSGGKIVEISEQEFKLKHYKDSRRFEYPSIKEQLGSMWKWLEVNGLSENIDAQDGSAEKMLATINGIKRQYPKG